MFHFSQQKWFTIALCGFEYKNKYFKPENIKIYIVSSVGGRCSLLFPQFSSQPVAFPLASMCLLFYLLISDIPSIDLNCRSGRHLYSVLRPYLNLPFFAYVLILTVENQ